LHVTIIAVVAYQYFILFILLIVATLVSILCVLVKGYAPVVDLSLPVINHRRVGVSSSGQVSYANIEARQAGSEVWGMLESALVPSGGEGAANWLDSGSRASLVTSTSETHSCCVGEDIGVDVELSNPLKIELSVTQLRLSCTFEGAGPRSGSATDATVASAPLQLREERITLHPGERAIVHLRARPLRTGKLHIEGVTWLLNGITSGRKAFALQQRTNTKKGSRNAGLSSEQEAGDQTQITGIDVKVMPPMPRLELSVEGLPPTLLAGQVARCVFHLKNAGAMTLHALSGATKRSSVVLEGTNVSIAERQDATIFSLKGSKLGVTESMELVAYLR